MEVILGNTTVRAICAHNNGFQSQRARQQDRQRRCPFYTCKMHLILSSQFAHHHGPLHGPSSKAVAAVPRRCPSIGPLSHDLNEIKTLCTHILACKYLFSQFGPEAGCPSPFWRCPTSATANAALKTSFKCGRRRCKWKPCWTRI